MFFQFQYSEFNFKNQQASTRIQLPLTLSFCIQTYAIVIYHAIHLLHFLCYKNISEFVTKPL